MSLIPSAWGTTIFCDDIRHELQGTTSIVGAYNNEMSLHGTFPFLLPKLALFIQYFELIERKPVDGTLKVYLPSDPVPAAELHLPFTAMRVALEEKQDNYQGSEDSQPLFTFRYPMIISPVHIKEAGLVRVRLSLGTEVIKLGALRIRLAIAPSPFAPMR